MAEFDLTDEQQRLLEHTPNTHGRVLAGPGTGKSTTMVALIERLLSQHPRPRIRLLTFSRAATAELAEKIGTQPTAEIERPSTIHSFAISLLMQNPGAGGFPNPLRIADRAEESRIIHPSLARRMEVSVAMTRKLIRDMAANWESLEPGNDPGISQDMRTRFNGVWHENRAVFGYTLLSELPNALRAFLHDQPEDASLPVELLIVDEYQDLNACDLKMLALLAARGCIIFAAGDDDQSIYSFRKAHPEGIRRFLSDYPGASDYRLSITQRCGRRIVEWARHVIEGEPDRSRDGATLTPRPDAPEGETALLAFRGQRAEAHGVAQLAIKLRDVEQIPAHEILILLRTDHNNAFSNLIKEEMGKIGLEYNDPDEVDRILLSEEARKLLSTFRLLVNQEDSLAWAALLLLENGVSKVFQIEVYNFAATARRPFGEVLMELKLAGFPGMVRNSSNKATRMIDHILELLRRIDIPETMPDGGWGRWISQIAINEESLSSTDLMCELLGSVDDYIESELDLSRFLGQVGPLAKDVRSAKTQGIRIMNMMRSKGLTVRATIIAAAEQNLIPRPNQDTSEERRLMYVAMTRAREHLYCTWAQRRTGPTARAGDGSVLEFRRVSPFLDNGPVRSQNGQQYINQRFA